MDTYHVTVWITLLLLQGTRLVGSITHQQVIGYLHVSFDPPVLDVAQGEEAVGIVNFTVPEVGLLESDIRLHVCCQDASNVIMLQPRTSLLAQIQNQTTLFHIRIRGGRIGKTRLRFYITKNSTNTATAITTSATHAVMSTVTPETIVIIQPLLERTTTTTTSSSRIGSTSTPLPTKREHPDDEVEDGISSSTTMSSTMSSPSTTPKVIKSFIHAVPHSTLAATTTLGPDIKPFKYSEDKIPVNNPIFQDFDYEDSYYEILPPIKPKSTKNTKPKDKNGKAEKDGTETKDNPKSNGKKRRIRDVQSRVGRTTAHKTPPLGKIKSRLQEKSDDVISRAARSTLNEAQFLEMLVTLDEDDSAVMQKSRVVESRDVTKSRVARKSGSGLLTKEEYMKRKKMLNSETSTTAKIDEPDAFSADVWWLPQEYQIIVLSHPAPHAYYAHYVVFLLTLLILFLCAGQLAMHEILYLLKHPLILFAAALARFIVIPGLTIGLVELLHPAHTSSLGMLALSCTSSDGASVLILLLLEADLSLGLAVLVSNSILAIGMLPLWSVVFQHLITCHPDLHVALPFTNMFLTPGAVLLVLAGGVHFQRRFPKVYNKLWGAVPVPAAVVVLLLLCSLEFYRNYFVFGLLTMGVFFMAALLACGGFLFGAAVAFISRLPVSRILVISIATGMHTSFLSSSLLSQSLPQPDADVAKAGPTMWSVLTLAPALLCACALRLYTHYGRRRYAATECTDLDDESLMQGVGGEEGEEETPIVVAEKETAI